MSEIDSKKVEIDEEPEQETPEAELLQDDTDWKAEALKARGIAKRNATRLEKLKNMKVESIKPPEKIDNKKEGFDNADKAYLRSAGLKNNEFDLVKKYVESGKSLDEVLDEETTVGRIFQAELKELRETKASKDAIPLGSKRSGSGSRDTVEYWLGKIDSGQAKLSDISDHELRFKVNNAKIAAEKNKSMFAR